jgi:hypothetical protein
MKRKRGVGHHQEATTFQRKRGAVQEIVFDPEARRAYLRGFSDRKKQRRAYGLAMQKLKDRDAKLKQRREQKKAQLEELKQLEQQQKEAESMPDGDEEDEEGLETNLNDDAQLETKMLLQGPSTILTKYEDVQTKKQWGGEVIVTTSTIPVDEEEEDNDDDDDDDNAQEDTAKPPYKSIDKQQKYAGSLNKYLHQVKNKMPSKKKKQLQQQPPQHRKGRHGATAMKGMGGAPTLKMAQKALSKAQGKVKPSSKAASAGAKHSIQKIRKR